MKNKFLKSTNRSKKIIFAIFAMFFLSANIFSQETDEYPDEYDDGYVYTQNGKGDQFIKMNLAGFFPLNFDGQLYVGGAASLGYYRFLNSWLALGGEVTATYNISIGEKILVMLPITFGAMFQPVFGKFEFPVIINAGIGYETWQNKNYFPSFAFKGTAGAFYRFSESWSAGLSSSFMWIPQWYKDSSKNKNGLFLTAELGVRYHF